MKSGWESESFTEMSSEKEVHSNKRPTLDQLHKMIQHGHGTTELMVCYIDDEDPATPKIQVRAVGPNILSRTSMAAQGLVEEGQSRLKQGGRVAS